MKIRLTSIPWIVFCLVTLIQAVAFFVNLDTFFWILTPVLDVMDTVLNCELACGVLVFFTPFATLFLGLLFLLVDYNIQRGSSST